MEPVSSAVGLYQGVQFIRDVGTQSYRIFLPVLQQTGIFSSFSERKPRPHTGSVMSKIS